MRLELEIFRNLYVSIAEEMGVVLRRTAFSPNIKERRDYSCAVYDSLGQTVAMGDHMPVHLGAMPSSVTETLKAHRLEPGDVVFLNDPFRGGTHLPDITAVSAVFLDGPAPAFYLSNRAHHSDVGGMRPGSMPLSTEIFQEGLRIPPVKLVRAGRFDDDLLAVLLANVRTPEEREGDLGAQLAALETGARRLREAAGKYGATKLAEQAAELLDYAERSMRLRLEEVPDGVYDFEDFLDDDGFGNRDLAIRCRLTVRGDAATVDLRESANQTRGGINANLAVTTAAVMYCFRCLIRQEIPYNAGLLRPIEILTKPGTIVDAVMPAGVAAGNVETSQRITDVVMGALAGALPDAVPAASSGSMNNLTLGGSDPRTGKPFAYYETIAGGMGARPNGDGLSAIHTHMTNSLNTPVEALERQLPILVRRYGVRRGSGGAGLFRGGDGVVKEIELLTDAEVTLLAERRTRGPYGLHGGEEGAPGSNLLNDAPIASKGSFEARAGDRLRIETPGGGGFGEP